MENLLLKEMHTISYKSYTALYEKWAPRIYRFIFSIIKSESIAEDIVQETFVKIWEHRNELTVNSESSFKSYLFTVSYHIMLKELRRQINHPHMEEYMEYCNDVLLAENTTEVKMDFAEFFAALEQAKKKLPPRQCEIFVLNKECHYSVAEIANKLSINEQTVRNQLSASLKIIRKELGDFLFILLLYYLNN